MKAEGNRQETTGNTIAIHTLLRELDALGVTEFCVCAGARNAPIIEVLTLRAASMQNLEYQIYHFFDERSASFFALGRVMESRRAVAVLTTSGTAVAELLPAMVEAYYQNLPLIAVTADRPSRYRGSGAPQAIEQRDIFGIYASSVDIEGEGDGITSTERNGPVHFNVRLEEGVGGCQPSESEGWQPPTHEAASARRAEGPRSGMGWQPPTLEAEPVVQNEGDRAIMEDFCKSDGALLVTVAGLHPIDAPLVSDFLQKLGAPIIAEATSNLRGRKELKPLLLRGGEKCFRQINPQRVLRIGAIPSWHWWRDLDSSENVQVLNVVRSPFRGLARTTSVVTLPWEALRNAECGTRNVECWNTDVSEVLDRALDANPLSEPAWMRHLSRIIPAGAAVFLGNSLPIREWNLAADTPKPGTVFFANRGANGIDGLVSSWLGVSAEADESWLIVGDLSALYDLGAPWILPQLKTAKRRIVVINNGGGKIFSHVSWLQQMPADAKRVMENPHTISFEPWARMWGMDYRLITEPDELRDDNSVSAVWEIKPDAAQTEAFWSAWK